MTTYPYKHQTIGQSIIGKPAKQHRWSIRGMGELGMTTAQALAAQKRQMAAAQAASERAAKAQALAAQRQYALGMRKGITPNGPFSRISGLGAIPYRYPYYNPSVGYQYNTGIPYAYYLALLQQQQQNWNYGRYPYGPYQPTYPYNPNQYNQYPYGQQQQYYPGVSYSSCVGSGGLWDSFANACQSANSTSTPYQYNYPYGNTYPFNGGYPNQAMPSVVGLSFASGVAALNQAGYQVWEISRDGVSEGYPPGYAPNRAVITVNNGIITSVYQG